ncbi:YggT family protein [Halovulum sp. GXIMD14793]
MLTVIVPTIIDTMLVILKIVWFFVIVQVIMSWLINFDVLNVRQPLVYQVWSFLNRLLEPLYAPIRRIIPPFQGIDIAPMVLIVGLFAMDSLLVRLAAQLY